MPYAIRLLKRAARELEALPARERARVAARIDSLADNPRPHGAEALQGELAGHLRIRAGDYRIIYAVEDAALVVTIVRVGHRREVYR
ncbi:MAG: type II toxin-antitoxin system RelE/ParE family toxin [Myxococcales bacterium]|nr:type II toxin-antitoxin system RelE/ParE family toxin [Myxococcales bacterium]